MKEADGFRRVLDRGVFSKGNEQIAALLSDAVQRKAAEKYGIGRMGNNFVR